MQTVRADWRLPDPTPENPGKAKGLRRSPRNNEALEEFAQNLTENIMRSFISQMEKVEAEEAEVCCSNQDREMFAEELASEVMERALKEVCRGRNVKEQIAGLERSTLSGIRRKLEDFSFIDKPGDLLDKDTLIDLQTSTDTLYSRRPLSQSEFHVMGSLDYPEAPPSTPLIPELESSRHSFARKLKGGLAMVFLPSPPPPTPRDKEEHSHDTINDHQVDLMERVMHSLSTDELAEEDFEETGVEAFAEALSCDVIDWVLGLKSREHNEEDRDIYLLAHQMAETIISSSLDAAQALKCESDF